MAQIRWTSLPTGPHAVVDGIIGGPDELATLARRAEAGPPITLDVGGVRAFTSTGVHAWIDVMRLLRDAGRALVFERCSRAVVRQNLWIDDFLVGGTVRSLLVPYLCASCDAEAEDEVAVGAATEVARTRPCTCGAAMDLDDETVPYDSLLQEAAPAT